MTRVALAVPGLELGGGVPAVTRFIKDAALRANGIEVKLVSLSMDSRDPCSVNLRSPRSWLRGATTRDGEWDGLPFVHVGANVGELESQHYRPRAALARALANCDLIQVVCGSPAWANAVCGSGKPVSLQVATRATVERRWRDGAQRSPGELWRRAMTAITDRLDDRALRRVDAIQVENPWMLDYARGINAGRDVDIRYVPPGVDARVFHPIPERDLRHDPYILCVGRLDDPRKNVGLLLEAFARVVSREAGASGNPGRSSDHPNAKSRWIPGSAAMEPRRPGDDEVNRGVGPLPARYGDGEQSQSGPTPAAPARLVLAGAAGPPASFWAHVEAMRLRERITFVARPDESELVRLYQHASVFALPSDEEGFGMVVIEAMACGIPVVATRCGGPDGIIADGADGYLVPRGDSQAMTDRLLRLLSDPAHNAAVGASARATIERKYDARVAGAAFVDVWERLLHKGRTR